MPVTSIIILAQGQQSRLPNMPRPKQLLPLYGCNRVPLLERTIRQIWSFCTIGSTTLTIIGWPQIKLHFEEHPVTFYSGDDDEDYVKYRPEVISLDDPGNSSLKGLARYMVAVEGARKIFDDSGIKYQETGPIARAARTIVLLGDVLYSWHCLTQLFGANDLDRSSIRFVGTKDLSPSAGELWGVGWESFRDDIVYNALAEAMKRHPPPQVDNTYQPGQLRKWLYALFGHDDATQRPYYTAVDDYTMDVDLPEHVEKLARASKVAADDDRRHGIIW